MKQRYRPVTVGKIYGETLRPFTIDTEKLLRTRMILNANSGGGKTSAVKKICEKTFDQVQHIIIDPEGEFYTLREKYPYVLVGEGGDNISAEPAHAGMLAEKIMEYKISVIINLYELPPLKRIEFVKIFLEALINLPKNLYNPCMVILDEAHIFAPEKTRAVSSSAVIDLGSRGRKRGLCLIPVTQRPAKLSKDVIAECQNKLMGLANWASDRKVCSDELGFYSKEDILALRDMRAGEFFAVGPAFTRDVTRVTFDRTETSDIEFGRPDAVKLCKPTAEMKTTLSKLMDLPKEAEKEKKTVEALTARVKQLEKELRERSAPVKEKTVEKIVQVPDIAATEALVREAGTALAKFTEKWEADAKKFVAAMTDFVNSAPNLMQGQLATAFVRAKSMTKSSPVRLSSTLTPAQLRPPESFAAPPGPRPVPKPPVNGTYGKCERSILKFLAMRPNQSFSKVQIAAMTFYAVSGNFKNALSALKRDGLIHQRGGDSYAVTNPQEAARILGSEYMEAGVESMLAWLNQLGKCEREIFKIVYDNRPNPVSIVAIAEQTGYQISGNFKNGYSRLRTLGLIVKEDDKLRYNPELED